MEDQEEEKQKESQLDKVFQHMPTIHDDSDDIDFCEEDKDAEGKPIKGSKAKKTVSMGQIKKSAIKFTKHNTEADPNTMSKFNISTLAKEIRRSSILDTLPEFELSKIERLEGELKVSESHRHKVEQENLDLHKRIKELELELEKQIEFNTKLKEKQKEYNENVYKQLTKNYETSPGVSEGSIDTPGNSSEKSDLYDENMISMSFNQALVKYENGQTLHSPYFSEWDEKIDLIQEVFKRWGSNLEKIAQAGHESSKTLNDLHKILMEDLIAFDFSTEIVNDLYSFADMLRELSSMQDSLYDSVKSSLQEYIKEFTQNFISKVKDSKKVYNKKFDEYYNFINKLVTSRKSASPEVLQAKIDETRKDLELIRISYLDNLNEIIIHTKVDLIDKVCVCIYCFGSFFKQGASLFEKLEPQLHSSTKKVAARNNIIKHLKLQLEKEKEKCKRECDNKDKPNLRLKDKEGFVFKQNSIKEWLLRYMIIRDESLFTVKRAKKGQRYDFNDAKFFCNIFLAKIRRSVDYPDLPVFEIMSLKDNKTFCLLVENTKEMDEWINVLNLKMQRLIENPQPHAVNLSKYRSVQRVDHSVLEVDEDTDVVGFRNEADSAAYDKEKLLKEEVKSMINDNICADCKTPFPEWFSSNLGVLVCITCSGYHRGLSTDISRVRSLTLDTQTLNTLKFLKSVIENEINRKVFEAKQSNVEKDRKKNNIKDFIKNKYEKKKF